MEVSYINLVNVFWHLLRDWKKMLVVSLLFALILLGYRGNQLLGMDASRQEASQQPAVSFEDAVEIETIENIILDSEKYIDESILMQLDPNRIFVTSVSVFIGTDMELEQTGVGVASGATAAYGTFLLGGDLFEQISAELYENTPVNYVQEIVEYTIDLENGIINFVIKTNEQETNEAIAQIIESYMNVQYVLVENQVGAHTLVFLEPSTVNTVDEAIGERQQEIMGPYNAALQSRENALQDNYEEAAQLGKRDIMMQMGLWFVLGAFTGGIVYFFVGATLILLSNKIQDENYLSNTYNMHLIATKPRFPKKDTKIRTLLFKQSNKTPFQTEAEFFEYVSASVNLQFKEAQKIHFVGAVSLDVLKEFCDKIHLQDNKTITFASGALGGKALSDVSEADAIVLVGKLFESKDADISNLLFLLKGMEKTVDGVVVLI